MIHPPFLYTFFFFPVPGTSNCLVSSFFIFYTFIYFKFFWGEGQNHVACRILVPWAAIEPRPSAEKTLSPNHRTSREFPFYIFIFAVCLYLFSRSSKTFRYSHNFSSVSQSLRKCCRLDLRQGSHLKPSFPLIPGTPPSWVNSGSSFFICSIFWLVS